jgi:prevent-host-death family protein
MAEPATSIPHGRLELSLIEARTRFAQLVRLAALTNQITVITDAGRPLAAVVPVEMADRRPAPEPATPRADDAAAAGWMLRIEKLRTDLRRQHSELEQALDQVWQQLDTVRPPGVDRDIDVLRAAHAALRRAT